MDSPQQYQKQIACVANKIQRCISRLFIMIIIIIIIEWHCLRLGRRLHLADRGNRKYLLGSRFEKITGHGPSQDARYECGHGQCLLAKSLL